MKRGDEMELLITGLFCAGLLLCLILDISVLFALVFGLLLFMLYGRYRGFSWGELFAMALNGVKTVRIILTTFLLIGIMTGLWRAAGTIAFIVCRASGLIRPSVFLLMTFLLNSGLSFLTGTSLGTSATMGMICSAMGAAMQVSPVLTGGAVLSGAFFGDRCSPVSTSALLVATVTGTDIYDNIRRMFRSAWLPFLLSCLLYLGIGLRLPRTGAAMDLPALYARFFRLSWITLLPAAAILLLAAFRVNVRLTMGVSILTAVPLCLFLQGMPLPELLRTAVVGFQPADAQAAATLGGGGIVSMLKAACIVCLSSAYSDLLKKTALLDGAKRAVTAFAGRAGSFAAVLLSSVLSGMVACNQTLTILLTNVLCGDLYDEKGQLALDLEDSAVIVPALIPWSVAGAVSLAAANAPISAVAASFYLILLPLCRLLPRMPLRAGTKHSALSRKAATRYADPKNTEDTER